MGLHHDTMFMRPGCDYGKRLTIPRLSSLSNRKLRTQALEAAQPQIVPISPGAVAEDVLQIHFRGAELRLPGTVDLDAVAAVLRSIQTV